MKKLLALIMAVLVMLTLVACGDSGGSGGAGDSDDDQNDVSDNGENDVPDGGESDLEYILANGKLVVGITPYEPMNYLDDTGSWTGFDTEFAELVCKELSITPIFTEINWDTKEIELNAKYIDCIWNGMTINPDRAAAMSISLPYVKNAQVIVVRAADADVYTDTASLIGKTVVAEAGSAGEMQVIGNDNTDPEENLAQATYVSMSKQTDCLLEVKAGTADAAVLDWTLAKTMVGEGTDYADLIMVADLELAEEEYGIAFRKNSDAVERVNEIIRKLAEDGTLSALAEKYGLSLSPEIDINSED